MPLTYLKKKCSPYHFLLIFNTKTGEIYGLPLKLILTLFKLSNAVLFNAIRLINNSNVHFIHFDQFYIFIRLSVETFSWHSRLCNVHFWLKSEAARDYQPLFSVASSQWATCYGNLAIWFFDLIRRCTWVWEKR